jgi:hypothetical protein
MFDAKTAAPDRSADDLIAEVLALKDKLAAAGKQFEEWCKPFKDKVAENENRLLAMLNEQKLDSMRADSGTAYKSTITSYKVVDRAAFFDCVAESWEKFGNNMLQLGVIKDGIKEYVEEHKTLPPGLTQDQFTRINIRRS